MFLHAWAINGYIFWFELPLLTFLCHGICQVSLSPFFCVKDQVKRGHWRFHNLTTPRRPLPWLLRGFLQSRNIVVQVQELGIFERESPKLMCWEASFLCICLYSVGLLHSSCGVRKLEFDFSDNQGRWFVVVALPGVDSILYMRCLLYLVASRPWNVGLEICVQFRSLNAKYRTERYWSCCI